VEPVKIDLKDYSQEAAGLKIPQSPVTSWFHFKGWRTTDSPFDPED
jgi:hypothetical protein